ncbi:hypothetical protein [Mangrovicoccus algicola]|uniref:Uncharacterized protein n=1 Tax=Mangrovicoccus algicola TaxID=2771008 RepID=A0A8J6YZY6_9RHOB|nr:hypothetical protein [Mangrovicoccus algicola]MBE3638993.1 hypothetical protein [Mangrovicoccus algicola]
MKKVWAFLCVVGFTGFWAYGLAILAALFGEKIFSPMELVISLAGAALGLYARYRLKRHTPSMHGRRAAARVRMEREYLESARG